MANSPQIPNVPASMGTDVVPFLSALKGSLEYLLGHGRNTEGNRALRVNELQGLGIDITSFLNSSSNSPYAVISTATGNGKTPDAPTGLAVTKGVFVHTLTWTNPTDEVVSHIEIWIAESSQSINDAVLTGIVTVSEIQRGETGLYKFSGFDVTHDFCYWIRSVSYAENYSEWHPTIVTGGVVVQGDESVGETIDGVIDILRGTDPALYAAGTTYSINDLCKTSDGRRWKYINATPGAGNAPPNATYWERAGVLMQGEIDEVDTIGIDGNLVIDGTILARHIEVGSITTTLLSANQTFIGHSIQSSNYVAATSGWKLVGSGTAEFNIPIVAYSSVTGTPSSLNDINTTEYANINTAITTAAAAQTTADEKIRMFTGDPTTPYEIGDIWDSDTGIRKCQTAKASGVFEASHWKAPSADLTSLGTAYNTLRVNGTAASTVVSQASGAFPSSSAGNLATRDTIGTGQVDTTIISGGKIVTGLLSASNISTGTLSSSGGETSWDLSGTGNILFKDDALLRFGTGPTNYGLLYGSNTGNMNMHGQIATVTGENYVQICYDTASRAVRMDSTGLHPAITATVPCGTSSLWFGSSYFSNVYFKGTHNTFDVIDDLEALYKIKSDKEGHVKPLSLPDEILDIGILKEKIKKENGDLLTDAEIDASLRDENDMGHLVGINAGNLSFLLEGAIRQLDTEIDGEIQQVFTWLSNLEKRLKTVEGSRVA